LHNKRKACLFTCICWLLCSGAGYGQAERGMVTGVVTNAAGTPLPGVTVRLTHVLLETSTETRTDNTGSFRVTDLRPGPYRATVSDRDQGVAADFTVDPGQERRVDLRLQPGGVPAPEPPAVGPADQELRPDRGLDFVPTPDRWRLELPAWQRYPPELGRDYPYVRGRTLDPYNQNVLKGDRPIFGQDVFFVLTGLAETVAEYRRVPTPSGVSTERPGSEQFFGNGRQYGVVPIGVVSAELFKGDTAFKPRTWAVRATSVFSLNYLNTRERNVVDVTPEAGTTRRREDVALQEAFGEVKILDVGANYDFVSVRVGIQPFNSDFRGFLFRDTNLGVRVFGTSGRNRNQWNVALFDQLEKETNSELNLFERRKQRVFIANYYRQDFLTPGYSISPSFHANRDDGEELFFDANGFLVRPSPIGLVQPHRIRAYYAGIGGDGHIGSLNLTHQFYQAFGRDEFNGVSGKEVDIEAQFAAVELSVDRNWFRPKGAFVFASGDGDPDDDRARGFDAVFDEPNIAGGPFSFWNRQSIRLTQTLVGLVGRNSILPSLRSSKSEGQASFVNPGLFLYSGGVDAELTRKLTMSANVNYMRFHRTAPLERLLFQPSLDKNIGLDASVGFQYRPKLNDNIIVVAGAAVFKPSQGFRHLLTNDVLYTPFAALTVVY
jgi:hypothetical protein